MFFFTVLDGAGVLPALLQSHSKEADSLAKTSRRKKKVSVKEMKFRHDPMIRFYEKSQEWLQEKGRPFAIAVGIIAGIIVVYAAGSYFFDYRKAKAENAFAEAVEKFNAQVQDSSTPTTTPSAAKTYADEQTKWQDSAEAFDRLASDYSGRYGTIGRYYAGVCYLHIDRDRGINLLEQVAGKKDQPTSDLARLALAENYAANGDNEKAISLYEELLKSSTNLKPAVEVGLGRVYEKIGDTEKAIGAYLEAARPDRSTEAGSEAEKRLAAIAPDRLKDLPPQTNLPIQP
jgi:tetratricopeptide (TPR) repeat protein